MWDDGIQNMNNERALVLISLRIMTLPISKLSKLVVNKTNCILNASMILKWQVNKIVWTLNLKYTYLQHVFSISYWGWLSELNGIESIQWFLSNFSLRNSTKSVILYVYHWYKWCRHLMDRKLNQFDVLCSSDSSLVEIDYINYKVIKHIQTTFQTPMNINILLKLFIIKRWQEKREIYW